MKKIILTLFLIPNLVFANCDKDVTYLKEGETAPCGGYLFTPSKEAEIRVKIMNYDSLSQIIEKQDELNKVLTQRLDISQELNYNLKKQVNELENQNNFEKTIYFCLGLVVGLGVSKIIK